MHIHTRIYDVLPTTSTVFTTLFPSMPPRAPQGGSRRPPRSPQKHPEKAHIKHFFLFQFFFHFVSFQFFFSDLCLFVCSCHYKQPQENPPRSPHPGGPRRHPEEAPGGPPRNCQEEAPRRPGRTSYVHDMCGVMCGYSPGPGRTYLLSVLSTVLRVLRVFNKRKNKPE